MNDINKKLIAVIEYAVDSNNIDLIEKIIALLEDRMKLLKSTE